MTPVRSGAATRRDLLRGLGFISPWVIGFSVLLAGPIVMSLYYSLCDFSVLQPPRFVGLSNYQQLFQDDVFLKAMSNTFYYAAGAIPLGTLTAISLAILLNTGVGGMTVYRTIFFLPSLIPSVAMAILWLWILNGKTGILNYLAGEVDRPLGWLLYVLVLGLPLLTAHSFSRAGGADPMDRRRGAVVGATLGLGVWAILAVTGWIGFTGNGLGGRLSHLEMTPPSWLSDAMWVKPAFILVSLYGVGNSVVIYLAGLQDVPTHLYEAADLDGANWWQKIRHVTLPMISPVILFNGIMSIIGTFNYFALPFVMAPSGQPARSAYFLAVNLFDNAFPYLRMGYASAMAWVLFLIVFVLTMAAMRLSERQVHYGGGA